MQLLAADMQNLDSAYAAFERFSATMLARFENEAKLVTARPVFADPMQLLAADKQALDAASSSFERLSSTMFDRYENEAALMAARLNDLSPLTLLSRGWAIARDAQGNVVSKVEQGSVGETLDVRVSDGVLSCVIEDAKQDELVQTIEWRQ
jgi:exodeoxyribonuclease VII large subunit